MPAVDADAARGGNQAATTQPRSTSSATPNDTACSLYVVDAERDLLAILLSEPYAVGHLDGQVPLGVADWSEPEHRDIYAAIRAVYDRGDDPGVESVGLEMARRGTSAGLEPGTLEILAAQLVRPDQLRGLARAVKVAALHRRADAYAERRDYATAAALAAEADALAAGSRRDDGSAPPFPVDALPQPAREFVRQAAAASDIDPAFVALPLLAIAGGLIGPRVALEIKSGWRETPQLWFAVVAEPGRGKTPGEKHARAALEGLQAEAWDCFERDLARHEAELAQWSELPSSERGPRPEAPKLTSYYAADATMEALVGMLSVRPALVVLRDELVSWVRSCDAYRGGKGGDRAAWLSSWSGVPIKVDRKAGRPAYIETPVVSVAGGIQPDMLPALAEEANRRDGFVERLLFAFPSDHVPGWTEAEVSPSVAAGLEALYRRLATLEPAEQPLRFDADARRAWVDWYAGNSIAQQSVSGILGGIYAKLPIQLARLALILHVIEAVSSVSSVSAEVTPDTLAGAMRLVEYFRAHAHRVVPHFGDAATGIPGLSPEQQAALNYIREQGEARSSDIAELLGTSQPSATNIIRKLRAKGLVVATSYGVYSSAQLARRRFTSGETDETDETDGDTHCQRCGVRLTEGEVGLCQPCADPEGRPV